MASLGALERQRTRLAIVVRNAPKPDRLRGAERGNHAVLTSRTGLQRPRLSLRQIAAELEARGYTNKGKPYPAMSVRNMLLG